MTHSLTLLSLPLLCAATLVAQSESAVGGKKLTLEQTQVRPVSFRPEMPRVRFDPEGELEGKVQVRENGAGGGAPARPRARRGGGRGERASNGARLQRRRSAGTSGTGEFLLQVPGAEEPRTLTGIREAHLSPDGNRMSFVRDHNLVISDLAGDFEWSVSTDGSEELLYGYLDWVYQEEVYGRGDFQAHWWSPDGKKVAFLRIDEAPVKSFTVVDFIPTEKLEDERSVKPEVTNYPKAGDPNPTATLGIADPESKSVRWIDLGAYDEEFLIVMVDWSPDGDELFFQVQDRIQTWLDLNVADPETGSVRRILREESPTWVNRIDPPRFLADGGFLWFSERTGYQHLYRYDADYELVGSVTRGKFPVTRVQRMDEERGLLWVTGGREGQIGSYLWRASLDGAEPVCLTPDPGSHRAQLNSDGSFFLDTWSAIGSLPEVRLCRGTDGEVMQRWQAKPAAALREYQFSPKQLHRVPARDGFGLDVTLIAPTRIDAGQSYPIWIDTYSGPNAPTVRNSYGPSAWHQFLAQNGVAVLQCNVRSASGRGQVTTGACYKQFGVQELQDLEDAIAWVGATYDWADTNRVGITGWSYGGFMSAFALTHSDAFALGVAGAGVYDWQLYDTIYTERYMSTPQLNPDGYAASSVILAADKLSGHLALQHGVMDDNVHLQNTIQFVYALQKAGKDFDLMLYPQSRHGVREPELRWHMRRMTWNQIRTHLLGAAGD